MLKKYKLISIPLFPDSYWGVRDKNNNHMKNIILVLFFLSAFSSTLMAKSEAIRHANTSYSQANYSLAAKQYEQILKTEGVAPELYYNLGNTYFKLNKIGLSILNYERALRLAPNYTDARINLELAQTKVVDNIVELPTFFFVRWLDNLVKLLTSNQWVFISLTVFILFLALLFLFIFGNTLSLRRFAFYTAWVTLLLSIMCLSFGAVRADQMKNNREAVVMISMITVKSSPSKSGTNLFQLHEGTKVKILSTLDEWVEIELGNGNVGWIEQKSIVQI
jgi:tetratricopeptide (TPR) repeat protein